MNCRFYKFKFLKETNEMADWCEHYKAICTLRNEIDARNLCNFYEHFIGWLHSYIRWGKQ